LEAIRKEKAQQLAFSQLNRVAYKLPQVLALQQASLKHHTATSLAAFAI